ncbi:MAG: hypothetical protein ACKN9T_11360, partial [Candidatus Methylumidiphilus sp.]
NALVKKYRYKIDDCIGHDAVAAYLFADGEIKPMKTGAEEGIIAETFDQVIRSLNDSSDAIFYAKRDSAG